MAAPATVRKSAVRIGTLVETSIAILPAAMRVSSSAFTILLLLLCRASAQQTWNVSPPGANLIAAFASARDGDTIVAAPGFYFVGSGISTSKALTVIGPGATVQSSGGAPTLTITGLAANRRFVMQGIDWRLSGYNLVYAFRFHDNDGDIHVAQCGFRNFGGMISAASQFAVENCAHVTLTECVTERVTLWLLDSGVQIAGCTLQGNDAFDFPYSGRAATEALVVFSVMRPAVVSVARSSISGGRGDGLYPGAVAVFLALLSPGAVTIAGDSVDTIQAGAPGTTATTRVPGIDNTYSTSGTLAVSARINIVPNSGQLRILGQHTTAPRPIALTARSAALGGTAVVTTTGDVGESMHLHLGLPSRPWTIPNIGTAWLEPASMVWLASTVIDTSETWTAALPIPMSPALQAQVFTAQALGGGAGNPLRLSTPGTFVIH